MQGIFQKENTDKALKYGIYRHLPTYEKIIRNLVSFFVKKVGDFLKQGSGSLVKSGLKIPRSYALVKEEQAYGSH